MDMGCYFGTCMRLLNCGTRVNKSNGLMSRAQDTSALGWQLRASCFSAFLRVQGHMDIA